LIFFAKISINDEQASENICICVNSFATLQGFFDGAHFKTSTMTHPF